MRLKSLYNAWHSRGEPCAPWRPSSFATRTSGRQSLTPPTRPAERQGLSIPPVIMLPQSPSETPQSSRTEGRFISHYWQYWFSSSSSLAPFHLPYLSFCISPRTMTLVTHVEDMTLALLWIIKRARVPDSAADIQCVLATDAPFTICPFISGNGSCFPIYMVRELLSVLRALLKREFKTRWVWRTMFKTSFFFFA